MPLGTTAPALGAAAGEVCGTAPLALEVAIGVVFATVGSGVARGLEQPKARRAPGPRFDPSDPLAPQGQERQEGLCRQEPAWVMAALPWLLGMSALRVGASSGPNSGVARVGASRPLGVGNPPRRWPQQDARSAVGPRGSWRGAGRSALAAGEHFAPAVTAG